MPANTPWTVEDMPNLAGRTVIVTGANSGTGFESARAFARKGAHTILACRSLERGQVAMEAIRRESPQALIDLRPLDLADLSSVRGFAEVFKPEHETLHILCNNAGVMALPYRTTADGFEMQFGTNHLGHFALTGLLIDRIFSAAGGRIVTVSSNVHHSGKINFNDLNGQYAYKKWQAYAQSKLANLLFAYELQRKLAASDSETISVGAHPGYAATNLQQAGPEMARAPLQKIIMSVMNRLLAQSAAMGALPILYAATSPTVQGGDYIGPGGFQEMKGFPAKVTSNEASYDQTLAKQLWSISEELTGVSFDALEHPK
jgi:NAD(P)-dependent dehydrogenase (short-subunit alcohol dehydrogenase family)